MNEKLPLKIFLHCLHQLDSLINFVYEATTVAIRCYFCRLAVWSFIILLKYLLLLRDYMSLK